MMNMVLPYWSYDEYGIPDSSYDEFGPQAPINCYTDSESCHYLNLIVWGLTGEFIRHLIAYLQISDVQIMKEMTTSNSYKSICIKIIQY